MSPEPAYFRVEGDPGVPDAMGRALEALLDALAERKIETIWIFPPLRKGRREHGLICAGCRLDSDVSDLDSDVSDVDSDASDAGRPGAGRHLLVTLAYRAEETGKGIEFGSRYTEEGEAPPDRLPVVIEGVVRRAEAGSGEPRSVRVESDGDRIDELLAELGRPPRKASPNTDAESSGEPES